MTYLKIIISFFCLCVALTALATMPIVISNQKNASAIVISNHQTIPQNALEKFNEQLTELSALLQINTGKNYFAKASLSTVDPITVTLVTLPSWRAETSTFKSSVSTLLRTLWQEALVNASGNIVFLDA